MKMYEVSYMQYGVGQANIYLADSRDQIVADFIDNRKDCRLIGIRVATFVKPGQPVKDVRVRGV